MNTNVPAAEFDRSKISDDEWKVRIELAAVYRLLNHYGWDEFIYNHAVARVPGEPNMFLIKKHEHLYTEVTASNLVKVDMNAPLDAKLGVNAPGFILHSGVMMARPDVNYSIHIHTPQAGAVSALPSGLRMLSQASLRFHGRIGYHDFEGIVDSATEREHLARDLGNKSVLVLRYHGVLVVGSYCAATFGTLRHFMTACEIQLASEATGQSLKDIDPAICEATARQVEEGEKKRGNADMPSYLRLADRLDPGYRS
jgi:ribulose-5-phosphate 4-epimerase/fuculose-1-phosphate aldolase